MSPALEKVRKLLALAGSDNENEARSAALSAARLIKKHGFEVVDQAPPGRTPADFFAKRPRQGPTAEDLEAFLREVIRGRAPFGPFGNRPAPNPPPAPDPGFPRDGAYGYAYHQEKDARGRDHRQDLDRRPLGRDEVRTCSHCESRVSYGSYWTARPYSPTSGWCDRCASLSADDRIRARGVPTR